MKEELLNIESLNVPLPIKGKLKQLSSSIDIVKQSGKGSNGWLFFGKNRIHNGTVAIKFYNWDNDPKYHAEPSNLAKINSVNVIQILDATFVDGEYAFFLTPYFEKGDLDEEISKGVKGNIRAISITRDILSGLTCLHSQSLLHRDIKPQNILLSDDEKAVIGDFGSVKRMPDNCTSISGSGHSLIYSPPESITSGQYSVTGDLYQVGIILYQFLGGHFPYEESKWLNSREFKKYMDITNDIDRQLFAKNQIKNKITRGRIIDISTLPSWVCEPLRRTISKACHIDPTKRFQSCSEFLAHLNNIRSRIHDWRIENGCPTRYGKTVYSIVYDNKKDKYYAVKNSGKTYRRDNSFNSSELNILVNEIDSKNI